MVKNVTIYIQYIYFVIILSKGLLQSILDKLPEAQQDRFDMTKLVEGFKSFNAMWIRKEVEKGEDMERRGQQGSYEVPCNDVYKEWFAEKVVGEGLGHDGVNRHFSNFFQNLQVRSASEVRI